ncbi:glycosyltransferase [Allorhizobium sp. NPDC080224]|uniref:glycosyltransferase n=1 Tax=Allorhizobium sp. NPDC080224 TaxID=3390547 RepID=UPI003D054607
MNIATEGHALETTSHLHQCASETLQQGSVLLVTAVRLKAGPRGLQIDDQTYAGLARYAENFRWVKFAGIALNREKEEETSVTWLDVTDHPQADRIEFIALPHAYRINSFLRSYKRTRTVLGEHIRQVDHLCFTLGYLFGDWGAVAALEANAQGRKFAVWFDRVEHDVIARTLPTLSFRRRIKERATLPIMKRYHRYLIGRSALGLFQGRDTFNAYEKASSNPVCMYDVHTDEEDKISEEDLLIKTARVMSGAPLRILYAGRAVEMKGPEDWISSLAEAAAQGVEFEARWLGDGPLIARMQEALGKKNLTDRVKLMGHVSDRETVLQAMRESDVLLFCHKTPESPRCLIESLVSGCPIVGYSSPYPQDLLSLHGGGALTPLNNPAELGQKIAELHQNRQALAKHIQNAALSGTRFDEATLYRRRAELLKAFT